MEHTAKQGNTRRRRRRNINRKEIIKKRALKTSLLQSHFQKQENELNIMNSRYEEQKLKPP
jgi:hypothetical protein